MDRKVITKVLIGLGILITPEKSNQNAKYSEYNNLPDIRRYFLEVLPKIERTSPVIPIKEVNHSDSLLIHKPHSYEFPYVSLG